MNSSNWPLGSAWSSSGKSDTNLNHRIAKVGSDFWISFSPNSVPTGTPQAGCPGPHPGRFWTSPWRSPHISLGRVSSWAPGCAQNLYAWLWTPLSRTWLCPLTPSCRDLLTWVRSPQAPSASGWAAPALSVSSHSREVPVTLAHWWPSAGLCPVHSGLSKWSDMANRKQVRIFNLQETVTQKKEGAGWGERKNHVMCALWHYPKGFYSIFFWYVTDVP